MFLSDTQQKTTINTSGVDDKMMKKDEWKKMQNSLFFAVLFVFPEGNIIWGNMIELNFFVLFLLV